MDEQFNILEALKRQYETQNSQAQSLSDRLNKIDEFIGGVKPMAIQDTLNVGRAELENPINVKNQQLGAGMILSDQYNRALGQSTAANASVMDALNSLYGYQSDQDKMAYQKERDAQSDLLKMLELQAEGGMTLSADGKSLVAGTSPTEWFIGKYGADAYRQLGSSEADRKAVAQTIYKTNEAGGEVALNDLLSSKAEDIRNKAADLQRSALEINSAVTDQQGNVKNASGVGILGGLGINPLTALFGRGQDLRSKITALTANKIKELSGAAVSDKEVARLVQMLPQTGDSEAKIAEKTKTIATSIQIGLDLQEKALRENLTLDQAYKKYGAELYRQNGEPVPSWLEGESGVNASFDPNSILDSYGY